MLSVQETVVRASRQSRVPQGGVPISIQVNLVYRFATPRSADLAASRCTDNTRFSSWRCALRAWISRLATSFGNLLGNTLDALLDRVRGRPASNSSFVAEAAILVLGTLGVPAGIALWALWRLIPHAREGVDRSSAQATASRVRPATEVGTTHAGRGVWFSDGNIARSAPSSVPSPIGGGYAEDVDGKEER